MSCHIDEKDLSLFAVIGQGAHAVVRKAAWRSGPGTKIMVAAKVPMNDVDVAVQICARESAVLEMLSHRSIISQYGVALTGAGRVPVAVLEFMDMGSLKGLVARQMLTRHRIYTLRQAVDWCTQIAGAIDYLHRFPAGQIVHRDVKLDNILLQSCDDGIRAKLADFGLHCSKSGAKFNSHSLNLDVPASTKDVNTATAAAAYHVGSFLYMAPEVYEAKECCAKLDVFSLAMIMFQLFGSYLLAVTVAPRGTEAEIEAYAQAVANGHRPSFPTHFPCKLGELIRDCWATDPDSRPTAAQVHARLQLVSNSDLLTWEPGN